jgi:hypothetical protein
MAGKARPSLRDKTLKNVWASKLSLTDKQCITTVFNRYEELCAAIERIGCSTLCKADTEVKQNEISNNLSEV